MGIYDKVKWAYLSLIAGCAALGILSTSLLAQNLSSHNSNAPVNFDAAKIELNQKGNRVFLTGNVKLEQGGLNLNANRMIIAYNSDDSGVTINRIDAMGAVTITKGTDRASGDLAIYDFNDRLITMAGGVRLRQKQNILTGDRLVMDLSTGRTSVDGKARPSGGSGRVSGSFRVPENNQTGKNKDEEKNKATNPK